jgi:hypothetical protein
VGIWHKQINQIGNARCQKWRENLSVYNSNVEWKEGKTHYIADSLSSAPYWDPPEVDTVFCFTINPMQGIHDILKGLPAKRTTSGSSKPSTRASASSPSPAAAHRSEWDYLSVINGLVVHDCKRIVIPSGAHEATLQVLHRPHAGVAKTTRCTYGPR